MATIDLVLEKYQLPVGEKILGKVVLSTDAPIKATKLSVTVTVLEKKNTINIPTSSSTMSASHKERTVYTFELPLAGEKEYTSQEFPFEMMLPEQAYPPKAQMIPQLTGGILGSVMNIASALSPLGGGTYYYSLQARLDIPWHIDETKTVDVSFV